MTFEGSAAGNIRIVSEAAGRAAKPFRDRNEGDLLRSKVGASLAPGRRWTQWSVFELFRLAALINGLALLIIVAFLLWNGWRALSWSFLTQVPTVLNLGLRMSNVGCGWWAVSH